MPTRTHLEADLDVELTVPDRSAPSVRARLSGTASHLDLWVSDPAAFAGSRDSGAVRGAARAMAEKGVQLTVRSDAGPLLTLGVPRAPWLHRRVTRSRHMRLESVRALLPVLRASRTGRSTAPLLPSAELVPAPTLYPLAPTFLRRWRMPVTTTHGTPGAGEPRLIGAPGPSPWPGDRQPVFPLAPGVTSIGSDPGCDLVLEGLDPLQGEVRWTGDDEFVYVHLGGEVSSRVNGAPVAMSLLRTGTRLQLGSWTLTYYREEYADHGRPYGGRLGGEIGHQRPQPPRARTVSPSTVVASGPGAA